MTKRKPDQLKFRRVEVLTAEYIPLLRATMRVEFDGLGGQHFVHQPDPVDEHRRALRAAAKSLGWEPKTVFSQGILVVYDNRPIPEGLALQMLSGRPIKSRRKFRVVDGAL